MRASDLGVRVAEILAVEPLIYDVHDKGALHRGAAHSFLSARAGNRIRVELAIFYALVEALRDLPGMRWIWCRIVIHGRFDSALRMDCGGAAAAVLGRIG